MADDHSEYIGDASSESERDSSLQDGSTEAKLLLLQRAGELGIPPQTYQNTRDCGAESATDTKQFADDNPAAVRSAFSLSVIQDIRPTPLDIFTPKYTAPTHTCGSEAGSSHDDADSTVEIPDDRSGFALTPSESQSSFEVTGQKGSPEEKYDGESDDLSFTSMAIENYDNEDHDQLRHFSHEFQPPNYGESSQGNTRTIESSEQFLRLTGQNFWAPDALDIEGHQRDEDIWLRSTQSGDLSTINRRQGLQQTPTADTASYNIPADAIMNHFSSFRGDMNEIAEKNWADIDQALQTLSEAISSDDDKSSDTNEQSNSSDHHSTYDLNAESFHPDQMYRTPAADVDIDAVTAELENYDEHMSDGEVSSLAHAVIPECNGSPDQTDVEDDKFDYISGSSFDSQNEGNSFSMQFTDGVSSLSHQPGEPFFHTSDNASTSKMLHSMESAEVFQRGQAWDQYNRQPSHHDFQNADQRNDLTEPIDYSGQSLFFRQIPSTTWGEGGRDQDSSKERAESDFAGQDLFFYHSDNRPFNPSPENDEEFILPDNDQFSENGIEFDVPSNREFAGQDLFFRHPGMGSSTWTDSVLDTPKESYVGQDLFFRHPGVGSGIWNSNPVQDIINNPVDTDILSDKAPEQSQMHRPFDYFDRQSSDRNHMNLDGNRSFHTAGHSLESAEYLHRDQIQQHSLAEVDEPIYMEDRFDSHTPDTPDSGSYEFSRGDESRRSMRSLESADCLIRNEHQAQDANLARLPSHTDLDQPSDNAQDGQSSLESAENFHRNTFFSQHDPSLRREPSYLEVPHYQDEIEHPESTESAECHQREHFYHPDAQYLVKEPSHMDCSGNTATEEDFGGVLSDDAMASLHQRVTAIPHVHAAYNYESDNEENVKDDDNCSSMEPVDHEFTTRDHTYNLFLRGDETSEALSLPTAQYDENENCRTNTPRNDYYDETIMLDYGSCPERPLLSPVDFRRDRMFEDRINVNFPGPPTYPEGQEQDSFESFNKMNKFCDDQNGETLDGDGIESGEAQSTFSEGEQDNGTNEDEKSEKTIQIISQSGESDGEYSIEQCSETLDDRNGDILSDQSPADTRSLRDEAGAVSEAPMQKLLEPDEPQCIDKDSWHEEIRAQHQDIPTVHDEETLLESQQKSGHGDNQNNMSVINQDGEPDAAQESSGEMEPDGISSSDQQSYNDSARQDLSEGHVSHEESENEGSMRTMPEDLDHPSRDPEYQEAKVSFDTPAQTVQDETFTYSWMPSPSPRSRQENQYLDRRTEMSSPDNFMVVEAMHATDDTFEEISEDLFRRAESPGYYNSADFDETNTDRDQPAEYQMTDFITAPQTRKAMDEDLPTAEKELEYPQTDQKYQTDADAGGQSKFEQAGGEAEMEANLEHVAGDHVVSYGAESSDVMYQNNIYGTEHDSTDEKNTTDESVAYANTNTELVDSDPENCLVARQTTLESSENFVRNRDFVLSTVVPEAGQAAENKPYFPQLTVESAEALVRTTAYDAESEKPDLSESDDQTKQPSAHNESLKPITLESAEILHRQVLLDNKSSQTDFSEYSDGGSNSITGRYQDPDLNDETIRFRAADQYFSPLSRMTVESAEAVTRHDLYEQSLSSDGPVAEEIQLTTVESAELLVRSHLYEQDEQQLNQPLEHLDVLVDQDYSLENGPSNSQTPQDGKGHSYADYFDEFDSDMPARFYKPTDSVEPLSVSPGEFTVPSSTSEQNEHRRDDWNLADHINPVDIHQVPDLGTQAETNILNSALNKIFTEQQPEESRDFSNQVTGQPTPPIWETGATMQYDVSSKITWREIEDSLAQSGLHEVAESGSAFDQETRNSHSRPSSRLSQTDKRESTAGLYTMYNPPADMGLQQSYSVRPSATASTIDGDVTISGSAESSGFTTQHRSEHGLGDKANPPTEPYEFLTTGSQPQELSLGFTAEHPIMQYQNNQFAYDAELLKPFQHCVEVIGDDTATIPLTLLLYPCLFPYRTHFNYGQIMNHLHQYIMSSLKSVKDIQYRIVFFNAATHNESELPITLIVQIYKAMDLQMRLNMKQLLIVHPNLKMKTELKTAGRMVFSKDFYNKIAFVKSLQDLSRLQTVPFPEVPQLIREHDKRGQSKQLQNTCC